MATSKITIKDGIIISHSDRYFIAISEDKKEYRGNGWVVTIRDGCNGRPGRIVCHAERMYSDGPAVCHREFELADGTLGLAGGNIHSRYAYFREKRFQQWLSDHDLQCVVRENPNRTYRSTNPVSEYWSHGLKIETDGKVTWTRGDSECLVTGATYVVIRRRWCDGVNWHLDAGILYTLVKDVTSITSILEREKIEIF